MKKVLCVVSLLCFTNNIIGAAGGKEAITPDEGEPQGTWVADYLLSQIHKRLVYADRVEEAIGAAISANPRKLPKSKRDIIVADAITVAVTLDAPTKKPNKLLKLLSAVNATHYEVPRPLQMAMIVGLEDECKHTTTAIAALLHKDARLRSVLDSLRKEANIRVDDSSSDIRVNNSFNDLRRELNSLGYSAGKVYEGLTDALAESEISDTEGASAGAAGASE